MIWNGLDETEGAGATTSLVSPHTKHPACFSTSRGSRQAGRQAGEADGRVIAAGSWWAEVSGRSGQGHSLDSIVVLAGK